MAGLCEGGNEPAVSLKAIAMPKKVEPFWEGYITTLSDAKYNYVKIIGACKKRGFVISKKGILCVPNKTGKARMGLIPEWKKQANPPPVISRRTPQDDTN
ncbi:hypothetical protein ANN_15036 [Periplaneta americana]|uniref:Uncharacterized protein n=1 Tax=Periplaneta americana TaxID=6978 RepID=A0ABQ8SXX6_PERAM|nr:hypothetical protein ANN_15036 [Periplaneta americana]